MSEAIGALASAVAACQAERDSCRVADATVEDECQALFQACRATAVGSAMPDLEKGVGTCAEASRSCRQQAEGADEKQACGEQLKTCVAESRADRGPGDGGSAGQPPVAGCIASLRSCIESDQEARVCTDELRACLLETLPHGSDPDADAGEPAVDDAGVSEDAGAADASAEDADSEEPADDGGSAAPDLSCKDAIEACVATGRARRDCMREQSCRGKP